jgi:hypothetical protein
LKIRPVGVKSVGLTPNPVNGGNDVTGKVTLECAAGPGDIVVTLSSTNPAVANPASGSVTVPQGSLSATFTITTNAVSSQKTATIRATANGIAKSKKLTVRP